MKYFLLEPTYKKSVVEYTTFVKKTEDATIRATREEGYRWGSWIIKVPETVEDAVEWCADMNCSFEDDFENDLDALIESATPDVNNDFHEVDDYNNEFVELFDGCWADWTIHVTGDGKDNYDEEEIQEEVENAWDEEWNSGVENVGYEELGCWCEIQVEPKLTPCDERGAILDEVEA
jgi:hypothetical protein